MVNDNEILEILKERVQVLSLIRDHYLNNQQLFVSAQPEQLEIFEKRHRRLLEQMLQVEQKWRSLVGKIKGEEKIQSENTDIILSLTLQEEMITRYFAYKDKLYQILSEVERIKQNSHLLAKNEFPFIPRLTERKKGKNASNLPLSQPATKISLPSPTVKSRKR